MDPLPDLFLRRLQEIIPPNKYSSCLESFSSSSPLVVRVNTLKVSREELFESLQNLKIQWTEIPGIKDALELHHISSRELQETAVFKKGLVYGQSLSSMLPAIILDPKSGERVLDLCAAPGSKTTQMAALMQNKGSIVAIEAVRARYYKLKSVVSAQGAEIVSMRLLDARRFRPPRPPAQPRSAQPRGSRHAERYHPKPELFDKILVDAPCSCEGRFKTDQPKTYAFWSLRKIKEMVRKQRGIGLSASRWLKPDGVLVYSTCSFAPEENEGIIDWLLRKTQVKLECVPIELEGIKTTPAVLKWQGKDFHPQLEHSRRILPDQKMEGFFIAKLRRTADEK